MRRLAELGIPDATLDALKKQATDGAHYLRNPESHGRIEWTPAGVDWLLSQGDLAPIAESLRAALKKTAAPAQPKILTFRAVRRAANPILVLAVPQDAHPHAPMVRIRVPAHVPITGRTMIPARLVPGFNDLYELAGKIFQARA